jgi:hypothetical protein
MKPKNLALMNLIIVMGILIFGILTVTFVFAYPILDSGISGSFAEDQLPAYTYNFTQNVTGSIDGSLIFSIYSINFSLDGSNSPVDYPWISINSETGVMTLNSTRDNETGIFNISINVIDSSNQGTTVSSNFNVSVVNDAPRFANLENKSLNISETFDYIINVIDEENNVPFVLNLTFINCSVSEWSTRNCSNSSGRELFNSSQYSFDSSSGVLNISFIPQKNDVGIYTINFSVMDNSSLGNKTTSQTVNFSVLNTNSAPYFRYVCDNERNTTEDSEFSCWINATDNDEVNNLTLSVNYSWFTFYNNSNHLATLTLGCNSSTNYNVSALVNFTPTDVHVGNWSINISIIDIGEGFYSPKRNSSIFWFFINNTEDVVDLDLINNYTLYEDFVFYVNATDNDLLVPDKSVKNEVLTFKSNTSWVGISSYLTPSGSNYTTARIQINYTDALSIGAGNYTVKVNVTDSAGNYAEREFVISVLGDNAVVWNPSMENSFLIYENNLTYFNFTQNVSDSDGDSINFSFTNDSEFSSFRLDLTTGIINFTPLDIDVGYHNITINASDGKLNSLKSFNFTILNINDSLRIDPLNSTGSGVINASVDVKSNIIATEDNYTTIILWVYDDDIKIPLEQKGFYNESFSVNVTIQGANTNLFSFFKSSSYPTALFPNRTEYLAVFTPNKSDIGVYNITINVSDANGFSSAGLGFNMTINEKQHAPIIASLVNQTLAINHSLYYELLAIDAEDGSNSGGNLTFKYDILSGINFLNESNFNTTTGVINLTFNSSQGGKYHINITVNDSSGAIDFDSFWIYVYDLPNITFPLSTQVFNLAENITTNLTFQANHTLGDNLTFNFYIQDLNYNNTLKYNLSYYGNTTNLTWQFIPNFSEETHGVRNLSLVVLNPIYPELNISRTFNITINHTNAPVSFLNHLGDSQADYNNVITINLSNYFSDVDTLDSYYNQTINFSVSSNTTPSYITKSFSNWTLTLSSLIAVTELLNITGIDSNLSNATSNTFEVRFTTPTPTVVSSPSSGGGGGGSTTLVSFKIIAPGAVSAYSYEKVIIPLTLENRGSGSFDKIILTSNAFKDGNIENKISTSLDRTYVNSLKSGAVENLTLTLFFDTNNTGKYEILINASAQSPRYTDWAKIYIDLQTTNSSGLREILLFTEEFIAENPECIELTELLNEAKKSFEAGDFDNARQKADEAINACRESISQPGLASLKLISSFSFGEYIVILSMGAMVLGIIYHAIRRRRFRKSINFYYSESQE